LGIESRVPKRLADEMSCFVLPDCQHNKAAPGVTRFCIREAQVTGEERWLGERQEKRQDFFIRHSFATQLHANLPNWNFPTSQQLALAFQDVFVKDVHVRTGLNRQFVRVLLKCFASQTHRFSDCLFGKSATPLFDDALPRHARGDLFQNIGDENASTAKGGLSVANLWISDDVAAYHFLAHAK
jgi:hypothetical protein